MKSVTIAPMLMSFVTALTGCGGTNESRMAATTGSHIDARNCEIFVDRIQLWYGSDANTHVTLLINTNNDRLDDKLTEVGFRFRGEEYSRSGGGIHTIDWHDEMAQTKPGTSDQFTFDRVVNSPFGWGRYEGVFYARTAKGTNYWLKPADGGNYMIDFDLGIRLWEVATPGPEAWRREVRTQEVAAGARFNPGRCFAAL